LFAVRLAIHEIDIAMSLLRSDATLETDRLVLRRITRDDLPFYTRIHADPEVARYLAHGNPRSPDETAHWLDSILQAYDELELGQVAVTRKSDGALLGRCGCSELQTTTDAGPDGTFNSYYYPARAPEGVKHESQQELGYTFDRAAWGNGYAREAVRAMWNYLSARRPNLRIVSLIHPENARSIRLASTFGVKRVDRVNYVVGNAKRVYDRYVWPAGNSPSIDR
jgi:RimJ/RimL family protein N-acetyltransferase